MVLFMIINSFKNYAIANEYRIGLRNFFEI